MARKFCFLARAVLVVLFSAGVSADVIPPANWDRVEATRIAASTETGPAREQLLGLATSGSSQELLRLLQFTSARQDWPVPARENVLYQFAQDLRSMPSWSVAPEVLEFLRDYESRVLVVQPEHPNVAVPLYNVRSAASGLANHWKREAAFIEGSGLADRDPVLLVQAYRDRPERAVRQGLLDSLTQAGPGQLEAICFLALAELEEEPAMTALAGQAALLNADARALEQLVRTGGGAAMSHILRRSTAILDGRQLARLLDTAVNEASAETASIAIAVLAPELARLPNHAEALVDLLGNPQLGSTVALALARNPSVSTLRRLDRLASRDDGSLLAIRARLALDINRTQFAGEVRR